MHERKDPKDRIGHPHFARSDPRYQDQAAGPVARGRTRRDGIPIPQADSSWLPIAQSWFRSLALSGQSDLYEASDWATAVAASRALDIALRTFNASMFAQFSRLSERLAVTHSDRVRARIMLDEPDRSDADEDAANVVVYGWQQRLSARRNREDAE